MVKSAVGEKMAQKTVSPSSSHFVSRKLFAVGLIVAILVSILVSMGVASQLMKGPKGDTGAQSVKGDTGPQGPPGTPVKYASIADFWGHAHNLLGDGAAIQWINVSGSVLLNVNETSDLIVFFSAEVTIGNSANLDVQPVILTGAVIEQPVPSVIRFADNAYSNVLTETNAYNFIFRQVPAGTYQIVMKGLAYVITQGATISMSTETLIVQAMTV
jgi:hypothetical protein